MPKGEAQAKSDAIEYHAPGASGWSTAKLVGESSKSQDDSDRNAETLRDALLASMQMHNVVVLAGSGCSISAGGPSMGDLWNEVVGIKPSKESTELAEGLQYELKNKNIEEFLSRVEALIIVNETYASAGTFLAFSKQKILAKCSGFFERDSLRAHETFLYRLSRRRARDPRLKLFTTNYDLCFERAAAHLGIVVLDGFSFSAPRRYDPRNFNYDIVRRSIGGDDAVHFLEGVFLLYKLHGSVNWARDTKTGTVIEKSEPTADEACIIYPAAGKYQQSFQQPFLETMAHYLAAIREPNTCVLVSGFGFNDSHLSEPLLGAVASNAHLRLVIVDPRAKECAAGDNRFWKEFYRLSQAGYDVWLIQSDFKTFAEQIPDLRALTPAEKLLKAVQGSAAKQ